MNDCINILIASDINYAPYYGVMLTSLFAHNRESRFDVYLITDETWTEKETKKFEKMCEQYMSSFHVFSLDVERMDSYPQSTHLNRATYFNLNAANILPNTIHKIIYMDGDMVVKGDISPLWQLDLSDYASAMVEDCSMYDTSIYQRLGYSPKCGFYNNGVTVYNLDYLRKINFSEKALKFIEENPEKALWMDQDAINVLLAEKTFRLPPIYNFQTLFLLQYHWQHYSDDFRKQVLDVKDKPVVIHYAGRIKPWHWRYYGLPYKREWENAYKASPWRCARIHQPWSKYIKHLIKRLFNYNRYRKLCQKDYIHEIVTIC